MRQVYFVTGNTNKLRELQAILPDELNLQAQELDLPEIQSMDSAEIVQDKLERAFAVIQKPVIVDDVAAELAHLNGLPGPFIKYFEKTLGKGALWQMVGHTDNHEVLISCTMGWYDGNRHRIVRGEISGRVVPPRGENGFGFDFVFVPEGETRTVAEMSFEEKNKISHRAMAAQELVKLLNLYKKRK